MREDLQLCGHERCAKDLGTDREQLGGQFEHLGDELLPFGECLLAAPVTALWGG